MANYSESEIEEAARTVASLIQRFGDAYWPILERLENELQTRRSRSARLAHYLQPVEAQFPSGRMAVSAIRSQPASLSFSDRVKGRLHDRAAAPPFTRSQKENTRAHITQSNIPSGNG